MDGKTIPLVSPKPCRTPNANRVKRLIFHNDLPKSAKSEKTLDQDLNRIKSFELCENERKSNLFFDFNISNLEQKIEADQVNSEIITIIHSNSCSPIQTPTNQESLSFFNSVGSQDTLFSEEQNRNVPNRTNNPFYKNLECPNFNDNAINCYLDELTRSKSVI